MKKIIAVFLAAVLMLLLFSGCSGLESAVSGITDKIDSLTAAGLVVKVIRLEEGGVKAEVVSGDSHFDEGEDLHLFYDRIVGTNQVAAGDKITVSYDYLRDVTADGRTAVIHVEVVSLYVPEP